MCICFNVLVLFIFILFLHAFSPHFSTKNLSSEPNLSAHERLFGTPTNGNPPSPTATSPTLFTPTFKSEAARKIVAETAHELAINVSNDFSLCSDGVVGSPEKYEAGSLKRRQKRRHYTISSSQPMVLETVSQKMASALRNNMFYFMM